MSRVFNFSAGPAALPTDVLEQAQAEMLDWHGSGMSVMEMSHRGKDYMSIAAKAEADLRELMSIPDKLQSPVPAGWCQQPVRDGADQPAQWKKIR
jgi:phosphoserine aminotransferase